MAYDRLAAMLTVNKKTGWKICVNKPTNSIIIHLKNNHYSKSAKRKQES